MRSSGKKKRKEKAAEPSAGGSSSSSNAASSISKKRMDDHVALVRAVVGDHPSEMDIIRALHLAGDDPNAAINLLLDCQDKPAKRQRDSAPQQRIEEVEEKQEQLRVEQKRHCLEQVEQKRPFLEESPKRADDWCLVGTSDVSCLSTSKGVGIKAGELVSFSYPPAPPVISSPASRPRFTACSEIMRFSAANKGEIGRIPNEWARCLLPLLRQRKVMLEASCKTSHDNLSIMDTIILSIRVYINSSMFSTTQEPLLRIPHAPTSDSTFHPLPALFNLLGLAPFKKADVSPIDLYSRKRPSENKDFLVDQGISSPLEECTKLSSSIEIENDQEKVCNSDVDIIVGVSDTSELEEMKPPDTLLCELRSYQQQALYWMLQIERGGTSKDAATTLHPCWDAYRLNEKGLVIYLNAFSGDATTKFPSYLQMARGGILADAMGLGKTVMTIALLLADSGKGSHYTLSADQVAGKTCEILEVSGKSSGGPEVSQSLNYFSKLLKLEPSLIGANNLIVCPMTLLSQWKVEIEAHVKQGSLTVYEYYGTSRSKDANVLAQSDVVLTTYGVLLSEFSNENVAESGLYSVNWYRVVLDEAHMIKSPKSQVSIAAAALIADRRWCLSGTPIQNSFADLYGLLRFLKVEPWKNWSIWYKLIQKPYEEGDPQGLKLVQSILKQIMLRRTKSSMDKEGRPILTLPPANVEVIYCELSDAERDFYEALFQRSKVKFDQFVEQGRVLHNYASILELLLRLRQCCDHPYLVLSRGDTQDYSDLNKLAKHFSQGRTTISGQRAPPSKAYINELVQEIQKGEGECPICLEAFEDAILTPCAHRLCRECLLSSWRTASAGLCPVCRNSMSKQDLITAPTESRFQIDVSKNWVDSAKVSSLLRELEAICISGAKSIIFSQWTAFLDLLQIALSRQNISFTRLDGTMNHQQRERVIKQFGEDKNILVLLMSLKAGGVGINLTCASNAFLMDPWWNPAVEEQAVMRIHRIGQTKNVSIKRFIVKGTVEERMEVVQSRKQRMISGALTDDEVRAARIDELKQLFS